MSNKPSQMISLGKKMKYARERTGLTQDQLAEQIGISRTTIARYELGEIEPKLKNLVLIAECLNVSVDYLLGVNKPDSNILQLSPEALDALSVFIKEVTELNKNSREGKH